MVLRSLFFVVLFGGVTLTNAAGNSGFLVFHENEGHTGMCLFVRKLQGNSEANQYQPYLSPNCLSQSNAWQWSWYTRGRIMSLLARRCLGVANLEKGEIVTLLPCDQEKLSWSCGAQYSLVMEDYRLDRQLIYHQQKIIGAHPILKPISQQGEAKWTIYTENGDDEVLALCDMAPQEMVEEKNIITGFGGKRVGVPCVFPFIYKDKEVWGCIKELAFSEYYICATSPNLDKNKDDWGACSIRDRGMMSDWVSPPLCDKACGGGLLVFFRHCLLEPCDGHLSKVTEEQCNTMACSGEFLLAYGGFSYMFPVDEVYPVIETSLFSRCTFPFVFRGDSVHECIISLGRTRHWCSLTEDYDKHEKWAYCSDFFKGAWSSWSSADSRDSYCSKTCGSGDLTRIRRCRFPPCTGYSRTGGDRCNTHPCRDCFDHATKVYTGTMNIAADGSECIKWTDAPTLPEEDVLNDPTLRKNYCRLPMKDRYQPYCYIKNKGRVREKTTASWMYCDLPPCGLDLSLPGIPYTVPAHPFDDPHRYSVGVSCKFPFQAANREIYDRCISTETPGFEWCRTTNDTYGKAFAYCPTYLRGRWGGWSSSTDCTKRCGGGRRLQYRVCLLAPCKGEATRENSEPCNTIPCIWSSPGLDECFTGVGVLYAGNASKTITGYECQKWSLQVTVKHGLFPKIVPQGMPALNENYCRNPTPGIRSAPWCYSGKRISSDRVRWEYCNVVKCPPKAGILYAIPLNIAGVTPIGVRNFKCIFPFLAIDGVTKYDYCPRAKIRGIGSINYCAIANDDGNQPLSVLDGLKSGVYGICPVKTRGTTGAWAKSHCSATCGGGFGVYTRKCIHPPCAEVSRISKIAPCNTHKCSDCFVGDGAKYHGAYHKTYTGKQCQKWTISTEFRDHPDAKENYCRNPDSDKPIPWCYTSRSTTEFCDPLHCEPDSIPYTIPQEGFSTTGAKCALPYHNESDTYFACQPLYGNFYCAITDEAKLLRNEDLGLCPPRYRGSWSSWHKTGLCSKACGGGLFMHIRNCFYPPCNGSGIKYAGECNKYPCKWQSGMKRNVDCYMNRGYAYVGKASKTFSGYECMYWDKRDPHYHGYLHDYTGAPLNHNLCRNPTLGTRFAPWCFTTSKTLRWEYCDVQKCPTSEGEILAYPPSEIDRNCKFPYLLDGNEMQRCASYTPDKSTKRFICGMSTEDVNFAARGSWGYCALSYRRTWSSWALIRSRPCSEKCGRGRFRYKRHCRFYPCHGPTEKMMGECNVQPCSECYEYESAGVHYEGMKSTTWDGLPCESRKIGIDYTVLCRNTDPIKFNSPSCTPKDSNLGPQPCGVRHCPESVADGRVGAFDTYSKTAQFCNFPFRYGTRLRQSCIRLQDGKHLWCSLPPAPNSPTNMGPCFEAYEGSWSTWAATACSKPCGGGQNVYRRYCRYPPCQGPAIRKIGRCNTDQCDETKNCYNVSNNGIHYHGPDDRTLFGAPCSSWNYKFKTQYSSWDLAKPECRNPGGVSVRPWCFTSDGRSKLCNTPPCPPDGSSPAVSLLVVTSRANPNAKLPCIFPFVYNHKRYTRCITLPPPAGGGKKAPWCATVTNFDRSEGPSIKTEFGYCTKSHVGMWISWSAADKACTKECYTILERYCLYPPCEGHKARVNSERCSSSPCEERVWTEWTDWTTCTKCLTLSIQTRSKGLGLVESQSKLCNSGERDGSRRQCGSFDARNDVKASAVEKLMREYMSRFFSLSSSSRTTSKTWQTMVMLFLLCVIEFCGY